MNTKNIITAILYMQTVFEDEPKRDRRLWLGDLRLEALANYETYRNFDIVKRSLYLLAGTCAAISCVMRSLRSVRNDRPETESYIFQSYAFHAKMEL